MEMEERWVTSGIFGPDDVEVAWTLAIATAESTRSFRSDHNSMYNFQYKQ
jgi:hypothetical protein